MLARVASRTILLAWRHTTSRKAHTLHRFSQTHSTWYKLALKFQSQSCRSPSKQHQCMLQQSTIINSCKIDQLSPPVTFLTASLTPTTTLSTPALAFSEMSSVGSSPSGVAIPACMRL